ncbi:VPLPA-CTERM sorting domain-containing protein [Methylomonas sp. SURF-1]|uniref:VPLPA-CTERM sorting domain-containing protein n=1 Tax=Methylomonas aurea TaxID=2952224 RepID=A0ABT1UBX3_9GAMM|nr:VPLPA-CTERM sorting domain-containing protein [Methylomonas sp. SURF-1]MCQ8179501.1 VPLPA-CTERM sorting domain-containing protein [Methylomonas sp. SURF-1]
MNWTVTYKTAAMAGVLMLSAASASAAPTSFNFTRITSNAAEDVGSQLQMDVYNNADASAFLNQTLTNQVLFTFANSAQTAANIAEVYFDDNGFLASQTAILNSLEGFTSFSPVSWTKPNGTLKNVVLPGGNNADPDFQPTPYFGANVDPGNPSLGVNTGSDLLGILVSLNNGYGFDDISSALASGDLRIGLHVRSIGVAGASDSFINNRIPTETISGVPLPASAWMFLSGLVGFLGWQRRRTEA